MSETGTRPLRPSEKLDWLQLIRSENVGPITFFRLLERLGSAAAALDALPALARRGGGRRRIKVCPREVAEEELEATKAIGALLVARWEPEYPPLLAQIEDPPPLISVLGHVHLLGKRAVAMVGARNASINGQRFARAVAAELGSGGLLVVSGMARGIDAKAHEGALATGTVAVLGGGVDVVYPKENQALYEGIRESGVLISEVMPGTVPLARHFPRRNRIISGLCRGVIVVEASLRSGSLITARMALEQGREVFAVPGAPGDPRVQGTNRLIREGAVLTESASDVVQVLDEMARSPLGEGKPLDFEGKSSMLPSDSEVADARSVIEKGLDAAPVTVDEIIRSCQLSSAVVSMVLLELELAGRLERHPGNQVSLIRA